MKREQIKQAIQLAELVKTGNAYTKTDLYIRLRKYAKALSNIDVHRCNGTKYNKNEYDYSYAVQKIYRRITEELKGTGLSFYHQSDPRGASLYVSIEKIDRINYTNNLAIY